MIRRLFFINVLFTFPVLVFGQQTNKIYFNKHLLNSSEVSNYPIKNRDFKKFKSAGAVLYLSRNGQKVDSLFVSGTQFDVWNNSVSFSVDVPVKYLSKDATLSLTPYFYLSDSKIKGQTPEYSQGPEELVAPIKLKIKSDPSGATVYLIPKFYWERNNKFLSYDLKALAPYLVSSGVTTAYTSVQEYVYIAVFSYKNKFTNIQFAPNHFSPIDSIFKKLN